MILAMMFAIETIQAEWTILRVSTEVDTLFVLLAATFHLSFKDHLLARLFPFFFPFTVSGVWLFFLSQRDCSMVFSNIFDSELECEPVSEYFSEGSERSDFPAKVFVEQDL